MKINVIDLDKTLIPYDSFRLFIKKELYRGNLKIYYLLAFKVLKLFSSEEFKAKVILSVNKDREEEFFKDFAFSIYNSMDKKVLEIIEKETDEDTFNILLSASPHSYVKYLIEKLGWTGSGSYFNDRGNFIHLYGENKFIWIKNQYDPNEFEYNMAISDSPTDDYLLSKFKKPYRWEV